MEYQFHGSRTLDITKTGGGEVKSFSLGWEGSVPWRWKDGRALKRFYPSRASFREEYINYSSASSPDVVRFQTTAVSGGPTGGPAGHDNNNWVRSKKREGVVWCNPSSSCSCKPEPAEQSTAAGGLDLTRRLTDLLWMAERQYHFTVLERMLSFSYFHTLISNNVLVQCPVLCSGVVKQRPAALMHRSFRVVLIEEISGNKLKKSK